MPTAEEEARRKALGLYRFLAFIQLLLGMGLLGGGRKGSIYSGDSFGPPFYLGGFIVGPLVLFSALVSVFIVYKGGQERNEVRNKEVACGISGQYVLCMFTIMLSFMGLLFAGMGSCSTWGDDDDCSPERTTVRYAIMGLLVAAIGTAIVNIYVVSTYGSYFGVVISSVRRRHVMLAVGNTGVFAGGEGGMGVVNGGLPGTDLRAQQLQRENELLQRQLQMQQQLNQQGQFGAFSTPRPPPSSYGYPQANIPPPPSYNSVT